MVDVRGFPFNLPNRNYLSKITFINMSNLQNSQFRFIESLYLKVELKPELTSIVYSLLQITTGKIYHTLYFKPIDVIYWVLLNHV